MSVVQWNMELANSSSVVDNFQWCNDVNSIQILALFRIDFRVLLFYAKFVFYFLVIYF